MSVILFVRRLVRIIKRKNVSFVAHSLVCRPAFAEVTCGSDLFIEENKGQSKSTNYQLFTLQMDKIIQLDKKARDKKFDYFLIELQIK